MAWADAAEALKDAGPIGSSGLVGMAIGTSYDEWAGAYQWVATDVGLVLICVAGLWGVGTITGAAFKWIASFWQSPRQIED